MKLFKNLAFILLCAFVFALSSCKKDPTTATTNEPTTNKPTTQAVSSTNTSNNTSSGTTSSEIAYDSEAAMENFVEKVNDANYVMEGVDFKTVVASPDQVVLTYDREGYVDYIIMSVNNETFQARLSDSSLSNLTFIDYNNAHNACSNEMFTINYITNMSFGNMFDLFYNVVGEDGKFVSNSTVVREFIMKVGGYSPQIEASMQEIYLVFDKEDVTEAHLITKFYNAVSFIDIDVDIKITFGNAISNSLGDTWMRHPVYPSAQTSWTPNQEGALDFLFALYPLEESGVDAFPFIDGVSYALFFDYQSIKYGSSAQIIDMHATQSVVDNYKAHLVNDCGFTLITDEYDEECYEKLLRADTECYSRIYIEYSEEQGLEVVAQRVFHQDVTEDATKINTDLVDNGFVALDNTYVSIKATDVLNEELEAYLKISEYDYVSIVDLEFETAELASTALESYLEKLEEAGFIPHESEFGDYYSSKYGDKKVWYNYGDEYLSFKFKADKVYSKSEINDIITSKEFIALDLDSDTILHIDAKSEVEFEKIKNGKYFDLYFQVSLNFENDNLRDTYLNNYRDLLVGYEEAAREDYVCGRGAEFIKGDIHVGVDVKDGIAILIFAIKSTR